MWNMTMQSHLFASSALFDHLKPSTLRHAGSLWGQYSGHDNHPIYCMCAKGTIIKESWQQSRTNCIFTLHTNHFSVRSQNSSTSSSLCTCAPESCNLLEAFLFARDKKLYFSSTVPSTSTPALLRLQDVPYLSFTRQS